MPQVKLLFALLPEEKCFCFYFLLDHIPYAFDMLSVKLGRHKLHEVLMNIPGMGEGNAIAKVSTEFYRLVRDVLILIVYFVKFNHHLMIILFS